MFEFSWFNFWSRRPGTLYGIRAYHPDDVEPRFPWEPPLTRPPRLVLAYGGKSFQQYLDRLGQHLWSKSGRYTQQPKAWADTVPGWSPHGRPQDVVQAGGAFVIYQGLVSPFGLWWREILMILTRRPYYNVQWNRHNPRQIPKWVAEEQRVCRDKNIPYTQRGWDRGLWGYLYRAGQILAGLLTVAVLAGVGWLFWPGHIGWVTVAWCVANWRVLAVLLLLAGISAMVTKLKPRRRRRRSSSRSRGRRRSRAYQY